MGNAHSRFCTLQESAVDGMKSVIRNLRTKSFLERRDFMVYERLGIKKVWDGKRAGIFAAYAAAGKGSWICRNKVRYIVNKNGSGHAVAAVAGGNNGMGRRAGESGFYPRQARSPGKRTAGNKYRDRRLLIDFPEISTVPEVQKRNGCYAYRGCEKQ